MVPFEQLDNAVSFLFDFGYLSYLHCCSGLDDEVVPHLCLSFPLLLEDYICCGFCCLRWLWVYWLNCSRFCLGPSLAGLFLSFSLVFICQALFFESLLFNQLAVFVLSMLDLFQHHVRCCFHLQESLHKHVDALASFCEAPGAACKLLTHLRD